VAYVDAAALAERANNLGSLNGMRQVRVSLDETTSPPTAILDVSFWNAQQLSQIVADPAKPSTLFPLSGGHRLRAGASTGMVQVIAIAATADPTMLRLTVAPIGDYSTYTLSVDYTAIDPIFSSLDFKFRPGCFSIDCAPDWKPLQEPDPALALDTLARDYDSFRHLLIGAMQQRVPGWEATCEADLSVTLLDLFSAAADELADYQDRVMNEAYLATARKRVSIARHARLVDYYIHEGNQASTVLALHVISNSATLPAGLEVSTVDPSGAPGTKFVTTAPVTVMSALDNIPLYTWDDTRPALLKGETTADLAFASIASANDVAAHLNATKPRLLIQEEVDPRTGGTAGRDPNKRQLVELTSAEVVEDPQHASAGIIRVTWRDEDALRWDFCFVETPVDGGPKLRNVSLFHGNLVLATAGQVVMRTFRVGTPGPGELPVRVTKWGALCALPPELPLLYRETPPDGITPPRSTVSLTVDGATGWTETISLVGSTPQSEHFAVETDELLRSTIRFGNGVNGKPVPAGAEIKATWRTGLGLDGNIGRDRLVRCADSQVERVWNPFDATNGRSPEPVAEIRRKAPEAYRYKQLRAVTLADYVARAKELPDVSHAAATYLWTGSWRTVRVTIDPVGGDTLTPELAARVAAHLEAVRLIGEDLEVRPPIFVPLRIELVVCLRTDMWPEDVRFEIEQELSDGWTRDGRRGLFHPDNWTFGQALHESEIAGRLARVTGVEHIAKIRIWRWNAATPGDGRFIEVGPTEIIQVHNDPDHVELGFIELDLVGGRR
jgi:hypothetical protein